MSAVRRVAQIIDLDPSPESIAEYERLHADVWPGVLAQIASSNIRNYSIWRHGTRLFAYFEYVGEDFEADMARMAEDPETQRWWDVCMPLQRPLEGRPEGAWWLDLPEVFHVD